MSSDTNTSWAYKKTRREALESVNQPMNLSRDNLSSSTRSTTTTSQHSIEIVVGRRNVVLLQSEAGGESRLLGFEHIAEMPLRAPEDRRLTIWAHVNRLVEDIGSRCSRALWRRQRAVRIRNGESTETAEYEVSCCCTIDYGSYHVLTCSNRSTCAGS
jgi:hypothetical protein